MMAVPTTYSAPDQSVTTTRSPGTARGRHALVRDGEPRDDAGRHRVAHHLDGLADTAPVGRGGDQQERLYRRCQVDRDRRDEDDDTQEGKHGHARRELANGGVGKRFRRDETTGSEFDHEEAAQFLDQDDQRREDEPRCLVTRGNAGPEEPARSSEDFRPGADDCHRSPVPSRARGLDPLCHVCDCGLGQ